MFLFLYLIACWTVIIDIVCFILFAVCLFVCFYAYCSLFMSVLLCNACVCHVLIKGNLLTYWLTYSGRCLLHLLFGGCGLPKFVGEWKYASPRFGLCLLWPNSWMDQDTTWYGGRPRSRWQCARWGPTPTRTEMSTAAPTFRPTTLARIPAGPHFTHSSYCRPDSARRATLVAILWIIATRLVSVCSLTKLCYGAQMTIFAPCISSEPRAAHFRPEF